MLSGQVEQDHGYQKAQSLGCPQHKLPLMTITDSSSVNTLNPLGKNNKIIEIYNLLASE